ncbi:MAG: MBL fold metallo-hydrolase [Fibrobacter sp.]|nr:MBL fold metallo-hydrolase [Fibrobacter sp.]
MILNIKTFYAVGQGGFYSERIFFEGKEFCVVYDCGAITKFPYDGPTKKLKQTIDDSGLEKMDCLVISHLDSDHINGLKLLKEYLGISKEIDPFVENKPLLILPKPTIQDLYVFFLNASEDDVNVFVDVLYNWRVLYITNEDVDQGRVSIDEKNARVRQKSHKGEFFLFDKNEGWLLKFYVDCSKFDIKEKGDELEKLNCASLDDVIKEFVKKGRGKKVEKGLKKAYEHVIKNCGKFDDKSKMNHSSLAMISAPLNENIWTRNLDQENVPPFISWMNGDISLKKDYEIDAIEKHFEKYLSLNIDFQIPHHGSHNNFSRLPKCKKKLRAYLWAGAENTHGHPSGTVLRKIQKENIEFHWITEEDNHIIRQEIWV